MDSALAFTQTLFYAQAIAQLKRETSCLHRRMGSTDDSAPFHKILVADPDAEDRAVIAATLSPADYEIVETDSGECALTLVSAEQPSLLLLSPRLADQDGMRVCRYIKANPETCHIVVVALPVRGAEANQVTAHDPRPDFALPGPLNPAQLLMTVECLLS